MPAEPDRLPDRDPRRVRLHRVRGPVEHEADYRRQDGGGHGGPAPPGQRRPLAYAHGRRAHPGAVQPGEAGRPQLGPHPRTDHMKPTRQQAGVDEEALEPTGVAGVGSDLDELPRDQRTLQKERHRQHRRHEDSLERAPVTRPEGAPAPPATRKVPTATTGSACSHQPRPRTVNDTLPTTSLRPITHGSGDASASPLVVKDPSDSTVTTRWVYVAFCPGGWNATSSPGWTGPSSGRTPTSEPTHTVGHMDGVVIVTRRPPERSQPPMATRSGAGRHRAARSGRRRVAPAPAHDAPLTAPRSRRHNRGSRTSLSSTHRR